MYIDIFNDICFDRNTILFSWLTHSNSLFDEWLQINQAVLCSVFVSLAVSSWWNQWGCIEYLWKLALYLIILLSLWMLCYNVFYVCFGAWPNCDFFKVFLLVSYCPFEVLNGLKQFFHSVLLTITVIKK